jgi:hypothetical protein
MIGLAELLREHPNFALPTQYCLGSPSGHTTLCFQNFYQQVFPDRETPVDLYVLTFDAHGKQVAGARVPVGTGEALQYPIDPGAGCGLVAAMAVPAFDLVEYNAGRLKLKHELGTGFYVLWDDAAGHMDIMHEWMQVRTTPAGASRYYMVFDVAGGALAQAGLVLTNPRYGPGLETRAALSIYTRTRKLLARCAIPPVPPMGSCTVLLDQMFSDAPEWFARHGALGACIEGLNLVEPLTAEFHSSGDIHFHHIN